MGCRERRRDGPRRARRTRRTPQHRTRHTAIAKGIEELDPSVELNRTGYFNYSWAPDFVMSWPGAEAHTMSGSSGSPVLDRKLELVPLHHGRRAGEPRRLAAVQQADDPASYNEGIPIARIQTHLADQGLSWVFGGSG